MTQKTPSTSALHVLTYRDVLHTRTHIGHISLMLELAIKLGYPYLLWNDRVYEVKDNSCVDTGLVVTDIAK